MLTDILRAMDWVKGTSRRTSEFGTVESQKRSEEKWRGRVLIGFEVRQ